jgi:hypothetical protein
MRQTKGIPKMLLELPARVVPGLVLLATAEYASGGTLWARLLMHVSAGLLGPENAWAFAVTAGLVVAIACGQLLDALGTIVEAATDRLLRRPRASEAFEWLQVNEEHAADVADEMRMRFKLSNSLAATFAICAATAVAAALPWYACVAFVVAAAVAAWQGASAKTAFRERAEKLRRAAAASREDAGDGAGRVSGRG